MGRVSNDLLASEISLEQMAFSICSGDSFGFLGKREALTKCFSEKRLEVIECQSNLSFELIVAAVSCL